MDTLYKFWDNITHYENESVPFLGLMNSATKECLQGFLDKGTMGGSGFRAKCEA